MQVQEQVSLAGLTRLGIGGKAHYYIEVNNQQELVEAFEFGKTKNLPVEIIGEGTNILASDFGFDGVLVKLNFQEIIWDDLNLTAKVGAGVNLMDLIDQAIARGWQGMENMYGIPGSVGAAIYGNVGAYGTEIKDVTTLVAYWDGQQVLTKDNAGCIFKYRYSTFKSHKNWIVLDATIKFKSGDSAVLKTYAQDILTKREEKYPVGMKCPGSFFKNIEVGCLNDERKQTIQQFADKIKGNKLPSAVLLEAVGAKGMSQGGIKIADYHANLIYNTGGGTAQDVLALTQSLKQQVLDKFGILLEEEVQFVGKLN